MNKCFCLAEGESAPGFTMDMFRDAVRLVRPTISFPSLDKAIEKGAQIDDLLLVVRESFRAEMGDGPMFTKHGSLKVVYSLYLSPDMGGYLIDTGEWKRTLGIPRMPLEPPKISRVPQMRVE